MTRITSIIAVFLLGLIMSQQVYAGNPDRQGEAGAYELLLNPWARSAGLNGLVVSSVTGVESMRFNPAGLVRIAGKTEVALSHAQYMVGTGLSLNAAGLAQKVKNGAIGLSLMSVGFGDIARTTTNQPEGLGTFSPSFFNIGLGYSHVFKDTEGNEKITIGATVRLVSESITNASATTVVFDAGVQYVTGKHKQIKFGLALRNIGTKMKFKGEGLAYLGTAPNGSTALTVDQRIAGFEMPSLLHIGLSYDFIFPKVETEDKQGGTNRITTSAMFTANSFAQDQYGIGLEYAFRELFMARVAFKYESQMFDATRGTVNSGLTAGITANIPLKKASNKTIGIDYAYEHTRVFKGTHTVGLKINL